MRLPYEGPTEGWTAISMKAFVGIQAPYVGVTSIFDSSRYCILEDDVGLAGRVAKLAQPWITVLQSQARGGRLYRPLLGCLSSSIGYRYRRSRVMNVHEARMSQATIKLAKQTRLGDKTGHRKRAWRWKRRHFSDLCRFVLGLTRANAGSWGLWLAGLPAGVTSESNHRPCEA